MQTFMYIYQHIYVEYMQTSSRARVGGRLAGEGRSQLAGRPGGELPGGERPSGSGGGVLMALQNREAVVQGRKTFIGCCTPT